MIDAMTTKKPTNPDPDSPVQGALIPEARKLATKSAFARTMGVTPQAVSRALAEGRITAVRVNGKELIDEESARRQWLLSTRQRRDVTPEIPRGERQPSIADDVSLRLKEETWRLQRAKAEAANLELDRLAGRLVDLGDVEFLFADLGSYLRGKLDGVPAAMAAKVASRRGDIQAIHSDLAAACRELLMDLNKHLERRSGEVLDLPPDSIDDNRGSSQ